MGSAPPEIYDVIIVGGGPAGLSAAGSAARQVHSTLILDHGRYRNEDSQHMHTVLGWDHRDAKELRAQAAKDFERYGCVNIERAHVTTIKKTDDGKHGIFELTDDTGKVHRGHKVVLCTGVIDVFPDVPGYKELWVKSIFHCLYCHGFESHPAPSSGMFAIDECAVPPVALHFARQNLRLTDSVTLYTHGNTELGKQLEAMVADPPVPMKIESRKIARMEKGPNKAELIIHFEDGDSRTEAFLAHKPPSVLRGDLHKQLGLELTPQGQVKVNPPFSQTSLSGCFAAGDMASPMQTVSHAMFSGTAVGAGAVLQQMANHLGQKPLF